jgi:hypothetical protein
MNNPPFPGIEFISEEKGLLSSFSDQTLIWAVSKYRIHQACIKKCQEINTNTNYIYVVKKITAKSKTRTHDPFDGIESILMHAHAK